MTDLIETKDLSKSFGDFVAVDGITIQVEAGQILALLGPNGAGKTTTIRMLASILRPSSGWARIAGKDVVKDPIEVRRLIGMLTEHHGLYTRMRAPEYLEFFGQIYQMPEDFLRDRIRELLGSLNLDQEIDRRLGEFSKGMRQKLALARAMLHEPAVLLLDEPTSAMDPTSARLVRESILSLRSSNRAIIVCTHNLVEVEKLADRMAIISKGKIVAQGTPQQLKRSVLGDPIMEVQLVNPLDGSKPSFPAEMKIIESRESWIRYSAAQPRKTNPAVLNALAAVGHAVITLSEVEQTLEEVYLRVVENGQENLHDA
ncbi:MAG: ABC transporter ATP-binding protein [Chloroflexi bacterium]|nr:ABC transporter ATP-binding protein [Chloroflexota bacterium]